jgi:hypothetical protein
MSYVYILSNEYMPGVYKVGYTQNRPDSRAEELYRGSSGVPMKFRVEAFYQVFDPQDVEHYVHQKLGQHRINNGREFFKVDPMLIERAVLDFMAEQDQVVGKNSSYLDQTPQFPNLKQKNLLTPFEIELQDFKNRQRDKSNAEEELLALKERERSIITAEHLKLLNMASEYEGRTGRWSGSYYSIALQDVQSKIDSLLSQHPWLKDTDG